MLDRRRRFDLELRLRQLRFRLATVVTMTALAMSIGVFLVSYYQRTSTRTISDNSALRTQLMQLESDDAILRSRLDSLFMNPYTIKNEHSGDTQRLADSQRALEQRISVLETGISNSPERFLSVPLLRKDLENESKVVDLFIAESRRERDQVQTLILWIAGILVTICVTGAATLYPLLRRSGQPGGGTPTGSSLTSSAGETHGGLPPTGNPA